MSSAKRLMNKSILTVHIYVTVGYIIIRTPNRNCVHCSAVIPIPNILHIQ